MRLQFLSAALSLLFATCLGQAPHDYNNICRTSPRLIADHVFPSNTKILLDSYDYENLISGQNPVWAVRDADQNGGQWVQRGGTCQYDLRACTYQQVPQDNWIFTQFVSYDDTLVEEVFVNITYRFSQCTANPGCKNDYVKVFRYDAKSIDSVGQTVPQNYRIELGTLQQEGSRDNTVHWTFTRPQDKSIKGFYLAFQDTGTCGNVRRIIAYNKMAPSYRDASKLVTCPSIPLPLTGSGRVTSKDCVCDDNAVALTSISRSCNRAGECTGQPTCACKPGYELNGVGKCSVCPPGTFKATISNTETCTPCPLNSASVFEGADMCPCDCNTIRPNHSPGADCTSPPSAPRVAPDNSPVFSDNSVTISWLSATDAGGNGNSLHYNIYTYDRAGKVYTKKNSQNISHRTGLISYSLRIGSSQEPLSVVVTSATASTGDDQTLRELSDVQNRFIVYYLVPRPCEKTIEEVVPPVVNELVATLAPLKPTVPVTMKPQAIYFQLGSTVYRTGSTIPTIRMADISEGDDGALLCKTDKTDCCKSSLEGEFRLPDGNLVPVRVHGYVLYRNRGEGFVKLNNKGTGGAPRGVYRCEVQDSNGVLQSISINIT